MRFMQNCRGLGRDRASWFAALGALMLCPIAVYGQASGAAAPLPANPYTRVSPWTPPPLAPGKKAITQDTYDEWKTISGSSLSNDGKWAVYTVSPVVGEGELIARATSGATEYKAPRGYTGRPQLQASADSAAQFSADRYCAILVTTSPRSPSMPRAPTSIALACVAARPRPATAWGS